MSLTRQIAKHLREIHFGGNWSSSNLKDQLAGVTLQQAMTQVYDFNTIAALVYHMNYYVSAVLRELQGEPLTAKDELSFSHPPMVNEDDWKNALEKTWSDAEDLANRIEQLPEPKLWDSFSEERHGIYYRNLHGIIEHNHYHLGQIVLIKKILLHLESGGEK